MFPLLVQHDVVDPIDRSLIIVRANQRLKKADLIGKLRESRPETRSR
jgi:hypothetical protein